MGIVRPTGGFAEGMLDGGGWPDVAEDAFYDRARQYMQVLRQVTDVLDTFRQQQGEIFASGLWSGGAAAAANGQVESNIDELVTLQNDLATAITWQRKVAGSIEQAKLDIGDNVEAAHRQIKLIEQDSKLEPAERTAAINSVVAATRTANVSVVQGTAEQILESKDWKPPERALQDLLDQKAPPDSSPRDPLLGDRDRDGRSWGQGSPDGAAQPSTAAPPPTTAPPPATVMAPAPVAPPAPAASTGGTAPAVPPSAPKPLSPAESAPPVGAGGRNTGMPAAPAAPAAQFAGPRDTGPAMAPASATGMPAAPAGPRGAAAGSSAGAGSNAPVGQNPSGASPSTRPASAHSSPRSAAAARPKPAAAQHTDSDAGAAVPVSAARAERDAAADATRRGEADPLVLARRIAAALNAPDSGGANHLKFFWVTAVTTEGVIVVANNYGLAYIPDGVRLPEQVRMASAEQAIPATERARWATYPTIAVQGWAEHRNTKLRAVIATDEQFADSDPGVAKVVLKPEDIPQSGAMAGRSRLEVVDPAAAERLAETPDSRLASLLPAPPATAPTDGRSKLWLEVIRPLASRATGRSAAHLRAFRGYAAHAQEVILGEARSAADPVAQRLAVADWLYWKHVTELLDVAVAPSAPKVPVKP
ncbi:secretion protein EspK [Mycobacterium lentiflavum]|uniref:Secretion protein EspK n=1 Tax=Mycobacterium lentiflavum TaxID=141349 RepID=A0ABY3UQR0_MYCLN|nr:secretion protein EspK [Mycobacterium lentiflavum]ULP40943.1 secretion protein EspK [Mycobacterium lentiflavum]